LQRLKVITGIMLTMLLVGMLALAFKVKPVAAVDWWPMFRHDLSRTGYSTSTAPNTNNTLWNYTTGSAVHSSPAVADGKVYVGSWDNKVYCFGPQPSPPPVGGIWIPVNKFGLLAPYIALASTILIATATTAIYVKRRKKK